MGIHDSSVTLLRALRRSARSAICIASVLNCNVGAWKLGPAATEIEAQTIRWIAEFIGYAPDCGGLLVSGGNMANFVGFLAARAAAGGVELRKQGVRGNEPATVLLLTGNAHVD